MNGFELPADPQGIRFLAEFPKWADARTTLQMWFDEDKREVVIIIAHPDHPPHKFQHKTGTWELLTT